MIEIKTKLSEKDFVSALTRMIFLNRKYLFTYSILLIIIILIRLYFSKNLLLDLLISFFILVIAIFAQYIVYKIRFRKTYRANFDFQNEVTYLLDNGKLHINAIHSNSTKNIDSLKKVIRTKSFLFLYHNNIQANILKTADISESQFSLLKSIFDTALVKNNI